MRSSLLPIIIIALLCSTAGAGATANVSMPSHNSASNSVPAGNTVISSKATGPANAFWDNRLIPVISASNAPVVDAGQYESFSVSWQGNTSTYAVNYLMVNSVTGKALASQHYFGIPSVSSKFAYQIPETWAGNTITVRISVTDTKTGATANSEYQNAITVNPAFSASQARIVMTINGFSTPKQIAISPDGALAYVANLRSNSISVINTTTNTVTGTIKTAKPSSYGMSVSSDGKSAYLVDFSNRKMYYLDMDNDSSTQILGNGLYYHAVALSPDGSYAYVSNVATKSSPIMILDTATNSIVGNIVVPSNSDIHGITFSPDGTKAYVAERGRGKVGVIDTTTNTMTGSFGNFKDAIGVTVSPDGNYLYVTSDTTNTLYFVSTSTNAVIGTMKGFNVPYYVGVMPNGEYGYVSNDGDGTVSVIDLDFASSVTPASPTVDAGQAVTLHANPSGGTTPYSYQWYSNTNCTDAIAGANSAAYSASPESNTAYCVKIFDSSPSPENGTATDRVIMNQMMSTPSLAIDNSTPSPGQAVTLIASVSGGTPPYTYEYVYADNGTVSHSDVNVSSTSDSYSFTANRTVAYKVVVADSAFESASANSVAVRVTVGSGLLGGFGLAGLAAAGIASAAACALALARSRGKR